MRAFSRRDPKVTAYPGFASAVPDKLGDKFISRVSGCDNPKVNEILHLFLSAVHTVQWFLF